MRAKLAWVLLTAVVLAAGTPASAEDPVPTAITDIRQESNDRSTRLTIDCTGPIAYTYYSPDPLTLVVDIPEVDASKVPARINVGTREVESLRLTTLARADGRNLARIEVRLASLVPYQIYSKDKLLNLVFERPAASAQAAPPQPAPEAASSAEPGRRAGPGGRRTRLRRRHRRPTIRRPRRQRRRRPTRRPPWPTITRPMGPRRASSR